MQDKVKKMDTNILFMSYLKLNINLELKSMKNQRNIKL